MIELLRQDSTILREQWGSGRINVQLDISVIEKLLAVVEAAKYALDNDCLEPMFHSTDKIKKALAALKEGET